MTLHHGDCIEVMAGMEPDSIDAIVCDPPYGLEFMGKEWEMTSYPDPKGDPMSEPLESRYELLHDDPRFALSKGDILICEPMHWAWAPEKVAVVRRESDGYEPGCSMYRESVRHASGPRV